MDADLADRIAFRPDGTISAVGPPEELLDQLPTVVRVAGTGGMQALSAPVIGEQLFPVGGEARGLLPTETTLEDLHAALDRMEVEDAAVEAISPTCAELFTYHVHVAPGGEPA